jgi:hypothetical protein
VSATVRRVGTCETCRSRSAVEVPAALHPARFLVAPCLVCRWPIVLAPPPVVEVVHEVVPGTEADQCRACGRIGDMSRCCDGAFVDRTVACACGARAYAVKHVGGLDVWRCDAAAVHE